MPILKNVSPGTKVSFPGKRRKFTVMDHSRPFLEILPHMVEGKNFREHPGTHLKDSSGRWRHTRSDKEVVIHQ
jgi:hypothetical protein